MEEREPQKQIPKADKRRSLRTHMLVLKVQGKYRSKAFFGYARNISAGGLFISSFTPKQAGEKFPIEFTLPGTDITISCTAEVMWSRRFDPQLYMMSKYEPGMGLKFLDLSHENKKLIDDWIKKGG